MAHDDRTPTTHGEPHSALVHAKDLEDFTIPEGQPDPRGWSVKTADGTTLGKVEDLLFDTSDGRIRYLEVKTDGSLSKDRARDYFLLPIGTARLDDENDDVIAHMAAEQLTGAPVYERGKMTRAYETSLRDALRDRPDTLDTKSKAAMTPPAVGAASATERDVDFYGAPEYDDRSFFSRGRGNTANTSNTGSGLGDRIAQKADDITDRFDGDPTTRPGSDATDRR